MFIKVKCIVKALLLGTAYVTGNDSYQNVNPPPSNQERYRQRPYAKVSDAHSEWKMCKVLGKPLQDPAIPSLLAMPATHGQDLGVGTGINFKNGAIRSSPFMMKGYEVQSSKVAVFDQTSSKIISSFQSMREYLQARTTASGEGWGVLASAGFSTKSSVHYQSNEVIFIAWRDITFGVDGMVNGALAPMTDDAKDLLCADPDSFTEIYGTHYVMGLGKGASIEMVIRMTTTSSEAASSLDAKMSASYSNFEISASASTSLENYLKSAKQVSSTSTRVTTRGMSRGQDPIQSLDIKNGAKAIMEFGEKANVGTTLTYQLFSYQTHPDYIRTVRCCLTKPKVTQKIDKEIKYLLISELIGMQTLIQWIKSDYYGLSTRTKLKELNKVYKAMLQVKQVVNSQSEVTFEAIDPVIGKAKLLEDAFLKKYQSKLSFPIYKENQYFVGKWSCNQAFGYPNQAYGSFSTSTFEFTVKNGKINWSGTVLEETAKGQLHNDGYSYQFILDQNKLMSVINPDGSHVHQHTCQKN